MIKEFLTKFTDFLEGDKSLLAEFFTSIYMLRNLFYDGALDDAGRLADTLLRKIITIRVLNFTRYTHEVLIGEIENCAKEVQTKLDAILQAEDIRSAVEDLRKLNRKPKLQELLAPESHQGLAFQQENRLGKLQLRQTEQRHRKDSFPNHLFRRAKCSNRKRFELLRNDF